MQKQEKKQNKKKIDWEKIRKLAKKIAEAEDRELITQEECEKLKKSKVK
ncbi:MAG: hypothetical protein ABEJ24_03575 [Candidatus Magasanikbacteria bacterium]